MPPLHRLVPLLLLIGLCPTPATAGGSQADYDRAARLPNELRGKVVGARLDEVWLDAHRVAWKHALAADRWEHRLLDARTGAAGPAFDHAAVAEALAGLTQRSLDPDRLELSWVGDTAGRIRVQLGARLFEVDPETSAVQELDLEDVPSARLEPVRTRRSEGGGADTSILFVNRSDDPVDLVWLAHDGSRKGYGSAAPGTQHRQHTYPGHVWAVVTKSGEDLGVYQARRRPGVVIITGEPDRLEPVTRPRRPGAAVSPDERYAVIIRDHNVVLEDRRNRKEHVLSEDGAADDRYVRRFSWSPNSRYLMVVKQEPAVTRRVHVVESAPTEGVQPKLQRWSYLKPGDKIARPRPQLFDARKRKKIELPPSLFENPWSISRFDWSDDGKRFRFLYNQRGHEVLRWIELDASEGAARALIEESSPTFVDYSQKTHLSHIEGTDDWLWMSERDGWNHLYRVDAKTGTARQVTEGRWLVREVLRVDAKAGTVLFKAMGVYPDQDPYHVHLGRVGLDGEGLTWLTDGDGTHEIRFSPDRTYFVDRWSRVDHPPVHELRRTSDGKPIAILARAETAALKEAGWHAPERFHAKGRDGQTDIWGVIWRPSTFDPKQRYPVIESIYAGPHGYFVPKAFDIWHGQRALAELGFVVVQIDGMGTNWRSRAFHDMCWKNLGDSGFPDRVLWLREAAKTRPWMDLTRVGIYGGSAGGQSALRGLLTQPDVYHCGVADCGCHDNRMDKIWWNEAWMGWPIGPHYAEQSNVTQAHRLQGKLLLIVGELDRNVDPASTMQVVDALIKADRDFELLVMPGVGHGAAGTPYGRRRQMDFFVRHLLGVEPRWK